LIMLMLIEILGWLGSVMVILAYALNINKKLDSDSLLYYFLNITGSSLLIINTLYHHAIPSMAVNVVWVLIAIVAIFKK
ncbi:MAG TPA: hypothetical protein VIM64_19500, partial [Puia sp.]